jgi:hypothetical protein
MSNKIKVSGYSKKEIFNGTIEYRNFSPDLVGLQLTSDGGTPLFSMGNFSITTNMDPKTDKSFITNKFSGFYTLENLTLTESQSQSLLDDNAGVILNLDKSNLKYYSQFGSLTEYVRVSLENIIIKWPASLYMTPFSSNEIGDSVIGFTFENYSYNPISDESTFRVNLNFVDNKFNINFLTNGTVLDTFNETNDLRNLTVNFGSYCVMVDNEEFDVLNLTGSTNIINDFIYLNVKGDVFKNKPQTLSYHIKPKKIYEDIFFNGLNNFEGYLLNRMTFPKYSSTFSYPKKTETGLVLYMNSELTWPVSDGYNIDFQSSDYINFVTELLEIASDSDLTSSNLMNRFLVSESISAFDTTPVFLDEEHLDTSGQKVNKTLNIYGRSFDEINNFITSISFANVVTYDKKDNTPDKFLKDLAKIMGWDLVSSILENDLLSNYVKVSDSSYSGQSKGLTPVEADVELWRRLILNSPWIWKSKGARKSIEFLLRFIGTPKGLVTFNEYVYKADGPIDIDLFLEALEANGLEPSILDYPVDYDGFPRLLPDTEDMYFQNGGLWYRETAGSGSTIDILSGNNPHVGPYDGGSKYINQLSNLIPNFSAVTLSSQTITTDNVNLFTNYSLGEITNYTGDTYVESSNVDGGDLSSCVVVKTTIVKDPLPTVPLSICGCPCEGDDDSLSICIERTKESQITPCSNLVTQPVADVENGYYVFDYYQYNKDNTLYTVNGIPVTNTSRFTDKECCSAINGSSTYTDFYNEITNTIESGYVCCVNKKCGCTIACDWMLNDSPIQLPLNSQTTNPFCEFTTLKGFGSKTIITSDGSNCPSNWTIATPNVVDPNTGLSGFGCKLTTLGLQQYDKLMRFFETRANGGYKEFTCCSFTYDTYINYVDVK